MKSRTLVSMSIVFFALVGIYVIRKVSQAATSGPKLENTIASGWKPESIKRLEISRGESEGVIIEQKNGAWILPKTYESRADAKKVSDLLNNLQFLQGVKRAWDTGVHKDFGVEDGAALHLILKDGSGKVLDHFVVGKRAPGFNHSFVRLAGKPEVYVANLDLQREAGLADDDATKKPEAKPWLDLSAAKLDKSKIAKLSLTGPMRTFTFERSEKKVEEKKEFVWNLTQPALSYSIKQSGVEAILTALEDVKADDVADPAKASDLAQPEFIATINLEGNVTKRLVFGKEATPGQRYGRLEGDSQVFIVPQSRLDSLFPKSRDLLNLPHPTLSAGPITNVTVRSPRRDLAMEPGAFKEPALPLAPRLDKLQHFLNLATGITPEDVVLGVDPASAGLSAPDTAVEFYSPRRKALDIQVGSIVSEKDKRRYMMFSGSDQVFIISEADAKALAPLFKEFAEFRPLALQRDAIRQIQYQSGATVFELERGDPWIVRYLGYEFPAKAGSFDKLLEFASGFVAEDVVTKQKMPEPAIVLKLTLIDGKVTTVDLAAKGDDTFLRLGGQSLYFVIAKSDYERAQASPTEVIELVLLKKRDDLEKAILTTEKGTQEIVKDKVPELTVLEVQGADVRPKAGFEGSKASLILQVKDKPVIKLAFGGQPEGRKDARYAQIEGAAGVLLIKEDLYQSILKLYPEPPK